MKTEYSVTPVICTTKDCGYKVTIESDYVSRNMEGLKEEITLVCVRCGGTKFKKLLK
jgi:hypothetical protein